MVLGVTVQSAIEVTIQIRLQVKQGLWVKEEGKITASGQAPVHGVEGHPASTYSTPPHALLVGMGRWPPSRKTICLADSSYGA